MTQATMTPDNGPESGPIYQGHFGEFTIDRADRRGVILYRGGLLVAALSVAVAVGLMVMVPTAPPLLLTGLYTLGTLGLGVSLLTIHIYMVLLHRVLQAFWVIGGLAAFGVGHVYPEPFAQTVAQQPLTVLGIGFTFAALTGIFFKEGFCFNRLETKLLTPLVPVLLLGHMLGLLPPDVKSGIAMAVAVLFLIFAARKLWQPIPDDIGDKSVFDHLKRGGSLG
jgi:uncharacterized integral membrane protein